MTENHAYKIMVVEDEAVIALNLQQMLTEMGYDVAGIAYSGEEAVEKARSLKPELILMDIMISGKLDGIAAAKIVKAELDIPVVFLTAFSEDKIIERAKKAEPYGYILKPFQDREIKAAVDIAIYKKEKENALKESEEKFRALAENAYDGILVAIKNGEHVYANKRMAEITGYSVSELLKTTFKDLVHPDEFEKIKERYYKIISGKPFQKQYETRIIRKDGKEIPTEIASARSKWKGHNADIVTTRDISERKLFEKVLQNREERYRAIIENRSEMICCFLSDGTVIFVNEAYCRYFGKGREELIGQKFIPSIPKGDIEKVFNNINALTPKNPVITHEHRVFNCSGETRWNKWTNQAIYDDQNNLVEYQSVGWDITKRINAETALRKAHNELEARVKTRTIELSDTLKVIERSKFELLDHKTKLEKVNIELLETNQALSVLARNIDREKELLENKIYDAIVTDVIPLIAKLQKNIKDRRFTTELEVLRDHLSSLISSSSEYHDIIILLTEQEMRMAALIKKGLTNKKIARMLFISEHTVKTHRKNIRKKLKIQNTNINLHSYLKSKFMDRENKI